MLLIIGLKKIKCSELNNNLFVCIKSETNDYSCVIVEDAYDCSDDDNKIKSLLNQIQTKIKCKIRKYQFKDRHPSLLIIAQKLEPEIDNNDLDFDIIYESVADLISNYSCITGVLFYLNVTDCYHYIANPNANENIKLSTFEIKSIFSDCLKIQ